MTLSLYIGYIYNDYNDNFSDIDNRTYYIKNLEWTFIKSILYEDHLAAKNQAQTIANKLTIELLNSYDDLNTLKKELDNTNKNIQPKYFQIMQNCIKDVYLFDIKTDDNSVFICNKHGVLANPSRQARRNIDKFPLLWDEIYIEQTNLYLTKEAVQKLLQQDNELIYWEFPNNDKEKIIIPAEIDIEKIHKLYDQYGLQVFKHIQFLVPAYITPTGDIFGIEDVSAYGNKNDNYKIIVVQKFNVYQQVMSRYSSDIAQIEMFKDHIITKPINTLHINALFIILIVIIIFILIYFIISKYEHKI